MNAFFPRLKFLLPIPSCRRPVNRDKVGRIEGHSTASKSGSPACFFLRP